MGFMVTDDSDNGFDSRAERVAEDWFIVGSTMVFMIDPRADGFHGLFIARLTMRFISLNSQPLINSQVSHGYNHKLRYLHLLKLFIGHEFFAVPHPNLRREQRQSINNLSMR